MRIRSIALASVVLAVPLAAAPAAAQSLAELDARMAAYLDEAPWLDDDESFFPRRGDWTLMHRYRDRPASRGVWRFPPGSWVPGTAEGGPFHFSGAIGPAGAQGLYPINAPEVSDWRRVGARYVPVGGPEGVFIDWRREDGRWVISAIGEVGVWDDGIPRGWQVARALRVPFALDPHRATVADDRPWFRDNEPIHYAGRRVVRYGPTRDIPADLLERYGTLDGVPVYAEAGYRGLPDVLYVPVSGGRFQPYQNDT